MQHQKKSSSYVKQRAEQKESAVQTGQRCNREEIELVVCIFGLRIDYTRSLALGTQSKKPVSTILTVPDATLRSTKGGSFPSMKGPTVRLGISSSCTKNTFPFPAMYFVLAFFFFFASYSFSSRKWDHMS